MCVGATNGATNGSVNYSASNPILWGVSSIETEGGFYNNGNNVFWRAHSLTMGSIPPRGSTVSQALLGSTIQVYF
ncbi:MAG: hypothetical protein EZS28_030074 [Streblomastix strix]|uniref:Uncharacterized protein n=1 Tax=Streblomastix strix TaxID=222440 RepID=A0A5J4UW66_9EUKA|nr:MAG: hypothetical protein EZS28_030074 [Streblomastix strix]